MTAVAPPQRGAGTGGSPPGLARGALAIAATEFRRVARDRMALTFLLVMPVVVIVIIGATIGTGSRSVPVGVVDLDRSPAAREVVERLEASGLVRITRVDDVATLSERIRAQTLVGGVVLPAGFGAALGAGRAVSVPVVVDQTQSGAPAVLSLVRSTLERDGAAYAAAAFATAEQGGDFAANLETARRLAEVAPRVGVDVTTVGNRTTAADNQYSYTAPSNLVLFVFVNALTSGVALVESRRLGVTRRMLAAPVSAGTIVAGTGLTRFVVALVQSVLILVVGRFAFGVSWGQPVAASVLVVVFCLVATGGGMLVGAVARNPEQAIGISIPVAIGLGMLGGCMWPLEVVPDTLRAIGHLTPHAWAMDAWYALVFEERGLGDVARDVAVLAGFAVVLLGTASWRLHRQLTR